MILVTGIYDSGVRIGVVDGIDIRFADLSYFDIPSERYLLKIEEVVSASGGWNSIDMWVTSLQGESFTSLRGLVTLVNTLSLLHSVDVGELDLKTGSVKKSVAPMSPSYSCEPNISTPK